MSSDNLFQYIDQYVVLFKTAHTVTDSQFREKTLSLKVANTVLLEVQEALVTFGIAVKGRDLSGETWTLTPMGHDVVNIGTWTKYYKQQREKEALSIQQIRSTIEVNDSVKRTNKWQIVVLVLTLAISGVTCWIAWLDYRKADSNSYPVNRPAVTDSSSVYPAEKARTNAYDSSSAKSREQNN